MTRYLCTLAAAATTLALFGATALPVQAHVEAPAHAPRVIIQTEDGKPILLATVTVTATALPD